MTGDESSQQIPRETFEHFESARMPRDEHGHDSITWNVEEQRFDCPVPEHTPTRIIDIDDASVIWEDDSDSVSDDGLRADGGQVAESEKRIAQACGAIGCTTSEDLQKVQSGARTRVLCPFHAQAFTEAKA